MEILKEIQSTTKVEKYKSISKTKNLISLRSFEYEFLYKEIGHKPTFHFVDENEELNFIIKMEDKNEVESIVNNKNVVNIKLVNNVPTLQIQIENLNKTFYFGFAVQEANFYKIKKMIENKGGVIHFVIMSGKEIIKCFSADIAFKAETISRFIYEVEKSYYIAMPEKPFTQFKTEKSLAIDIEANYGFLEELLDIILKLSKWNSTDDFEIYVEKTQNYRVLLSGIVKNLNYIKKEIQKNYTIVDENFIESKGKPFLKYEFGRVYFLKANQDEN